MKPEQQTDDQILAGLDDPDETVRSRSAVELARRHHPRAVEACLRTLKDRAEPANVYSTPSVWALVQIGVPALRPLLARLMDEDATTRLCAMHAVEQITKRQFGFDGLQWPAHAYDRWARWWQHIGYAHDADSATRASAVQRLHESCGGWTEVG